VSGRRRRCASTDLLGALFYPTRTEHRERPPLRDEYASSSGEWLAFNAGSAPLAIWFSSASTSVTLKAGSKWDDRQVSAARDLSRR
jgi:hypothetical protein